MITFFLKEKISLCGKKVQRKILIYRGPISFKRRYYPSCFDSYLDSQYLGCSQEGQNSHIYAPRFGKYANRFSPSTIEKLSLIREANAMNAKVILVHKHRPIPLPIPLSIPDIDLDVPIRFHIDTRHMKPSIRKILNAFKYGFVNIFLVTIVGLTYKNKTLPPNKSISKQS